MSSTFLLITSTGKYLYPQTFARPMFKIDHAPHRFKDSTHFRDLLDEVPTYEFEDD